MLRRIEILEVAQGSNSKERQMQRLNPKASPARHANCHSAARSQALMVALKLMTFVGVPASWDRESRFLGLGICKFGL